MQSKQCVVCGAETDELAPEGECFECSTGDRPDDFHKEPEKPAVWVQPKEKVRA